MQQFTNYLPLILGAIGAVFTGGWFFFGRKKGAVTAALASAEFNDVSSLVTAYTQRLGELSQDITKLHEELTQVRANQMQLEQENKQLRTDNAQLKQRLNQIENERSAKKD
jgi:septal ring factor EnvC (AmiA/AmiB activator)